MFRLTHYEVCGLIFALLLGILAGYSIANPAGLDPAESSSALSHPHALLGKMRDDKLQLYYLEDKLGANVYLTEDPRPIQELLCLVAGPRYSAKWKGTVCFSKMPSGWYTDTSSWGDSGYQVDNWQVFGDPVLVRETKGALKSVTP